MRFFCEWLLHLGVSFPIRESLFDFKILTVESNWFDELFLHAWEVGLLLILLFLF